MELRTEQRHIRNNYPNNDLAAFVLLADNYESRVCSLVCSKLRKFRYIYVEDIVKKIFIRACQVTHSGAMAQILRLGLHHDFQPLQNYDRLQSRHHYSEFVEAYTPRGWQIASASPQGNRQRCAENESEVNSDDNRQFLYTRRDGSQGLARASKGIELKAEGRLSSMFLGNV